MGGTACSRYQAYWYSHRSNEFNAAQRLRSIMTHFPGKVGTRRRGDRIGDRVGGCRIGQAGHGDRGCRPRHGAGRDALCFQPCDKAAPNRGCGYPAQHPAELDRGQRWQGQRLHPGQRRGVCGGSGHRRDRRGAQSRTGGQVGLTCTNGIVVDSHMRSSAPKIYAIGDCTAAETLPWRALPDRDDPQCHVAGPDRRAQPLWPRGAGADCGAFIDNDHVVAH